MIGSAPNVQRIPRVVIVGAGFAGLCAAKGLAKAAAEVLVVDRSNHHLFQPLLYQAATASLSPHQIASPIRSILRRQKNATVVLDEAIGVDAARQEAILRDRAIAYDYLVLATGAQHDYFGRNEWEDWAPGLKTIVDAERIRERLLVALERAEAAEPGPARERALTFVIVGGGPTGVELAGAIAELGGRALACDFRRTRCSDPRVILAEAGPRLLPAFSEAASRYVKKALERRGVEVRLSGPVTDVREGAVKIGDVVVEAGNVIWAAGVKSSPAAAWLGVPRDRAGRAKVEHDLSVSGRSNVFIIGDAARAVDASGAATPGIAPAAKQMGAYVARVIAARIAEKPPPAPFRYRHAGSLATIGRNAAVAEVGRVRLTGLAAWIFWSAAHIWFLIGFRNRILVALDWMWSYLTLERGARIIHQTAPLAETADPQGGAMRAVEARAGNS